METRNDRVWQTSDLVRTFLEGVRGGIPMAEEQLDVMARVVAARNRPLTRFLDLGCGSGILGATLLERHPGATGIFLDFSTPMLDAARQRLGAPGNSHRFINADFADPAWVRTVADRAPFDAVVSGYAIHHQPDARKRQIYAEVFGLLAPGGVFVHVEHVSSAAPWVESLFEALFIDTHYALAEKRGIPKTREQIAREYYHRDDKKANILAPLETQCGWLRDIGFRDVDCYFKIFELAVFGGRRPEA